MKDRLERFVLLPFTAGCMSESSIPVVMPPTKRSKQGSNSPPKEKHDEKEDEEEGCLDEEERLSGQNLKSNIPRFQKLFRNFKDFSQLFVYKEEMEADTGMEIGLPTDVKHVTHIGLDNLDGCTSSIFSNGWKNLSEHELIDLHSFPLPELEFAFKAQGETTNMKSSLEGSCHFGNNSSPAMGVMQS